MKNRKCKASWNSIFIFELTLIVLVMISTIFSHCGLSDENVELPIDVINIPNLENIPEDIFSTTAVDINDNSILIGWTESSNFPLAYGYDAPSRGFSIHSSGNNYHTITGPDVYSLWPLEINNHNKVVGAYVHEDEDLSVQDGTAIPCRAFYANHDGSNFTDVHPEGYTYSLLYMINDMNLAVGKAGNDLEFQLEEYYFLYDIANGKYVDHPFANMNTIQIWEMNNDHIIVGFREEPSDLEEINTILFRLQDFIPVDTLPLQEIPYPEDIEITGINEKNQIIGNYTDLGDNFGFQGFTYLPGSGQIRIIPMNRKAGNWEYVEFNPQDINEKGEITGTGYRIGKEFFLSQARACRISWDLDHFEDITPPNRDSYGESYAINSLHEITGYAGFMQKFNSVIVNRAFIIR